MAKCGSISEAAKKNYTSQPALSKAIKKLEDQLEVKLFHRTLSGIELTDEGRELLFFVEKSFNNLIIAERRLLENKSLERGKLSIGMPSNVGSFFLFDKIIEFHKQYPNIEITIVTGSTNKLLESLNSHNVDFVIDTSPINTQDVNLVIKPLINVEYAFIAKKNTKLFKPESICKLKDLETLPLVLPIPGTANRVDLDGILQDNNVVIDNVLNIHTTEMIIAFVKQDLGVGYVIKNLVKGEIEHGAIIALNIKETLPTVDINLVYNQNYLTTVPTNFIENYLN